MTTEQFHSMTKAEFSVYRERVRAKADGANIHEVDGCLGRILNSLDNLKFWRSVEQTDETKKHVALCENLLDNARLEIGQLTGVKD